MSTASRVGLLIFLASASARGQTIQDLGVLPGHDRSVATSMSADGSVVFGTSDFSSSQIRAVRWTQATGLQQLSLNNPLDQTFGGLCSDDGTKSGGGLSRSQSNVAGYRWTLSGGSVDMPANGTLTPVDCHGVTRFGNYYFGRARQPSGAMHSYRWTPAGGFQFLGVLPVNSFNSEAYDANEDGSIIVGSCDLFGVSNATRWTAATGQQLLGSMPYASSTYAMRTNRGGDVIVGYGLGAQGSRAFRWTQPTGLVDLGAPPGMTTSLLSAVSDDGDLLLGSMWTVGPFNYTACYWRPTTGYMSVQSHLAALGMNLSGWTLGSVSAISQNLTTIAGSGTHNGAARAFRITGIPCWSAPVIVNDGIRSLSLCEGQQIELNVLGGGEHAINVFYQWYYNGLPISDGIQPSGAVAYGAATGSIIITGASGADSGFYQCMIYNQCGSVTTAATNVTVSSPPSYTAAMAPQEVCVGGSVNLNVFASSSLPATYQWEYLDPVAGWYPVPNGLLADFFNGLFIFTSGTTSPTLSLSNVNLGAYAPLRFRCVVSNACGTAPLRGQFVTVSHAQPLSVFGQPSDLTSCAFGPANFSAFFNGTSPQYQWETYSYYFNTWVALNNGQYQDLYNNIKFTATGTGTPNLTITNVYLGNHDGPLLYRCVGTGACNSVVTNVVQHTVCPGDFNCDGGIDGDDVIAMLSLWDLGDPGADINFDGGVDGDDVILFFGYWDAGC